MRMTALVMTTHKSGLLAYVRGSVQLLQITDEDALRIVLRNRLLQHGEHHWETRDRWRFIEPCFHPWKPDQDG